MKKLSSCKENCLAWKAGISGPLLKKSVIPALGYTEGSDHSGEKNGEKKSRDSCPGERLDFHVCLIHSFIRLSTPTQLGYCGIEKHPGKVLI